MGHFKENCSLCGKIISQCRCANPNKEQRYGICKDCKNFGGKNKFKIGDKVGIHSPSIIESIHFMDKDTGKRYKEPIYVITSCSDNSLECFYESELFLIN